MRERWFQLHGGRRTVEGASEACMHRSVAGDTSVPVVLRRLRFAHASVRCESVRAVRARESWE